MVVITLAVHELREFLKYNGRVHDTKDGPVEQHQHAVEQFTNYVATLALAHDKQLHKAFTWQLNGYKLQIINA
jgi:hypothetical protein